MIERRRFMAKAGGVVAGGAATALVPAPAVIAQPRIQWRMPTTWAKQLDNLRAPPTGWPRWSRR